MSSARVRDVPGLDREPRDRSEAQVAERDASGADWQRRKARCVPLGVTLIRNARRRPWRMALVDEIRGPVSAMKGLAGAIVLARALREQWRDQKRVGVLLPPSVGGALVNMAAAVGGRVTVNLNYTAGRDGMEAAVRTAELRSLVTSRRFVERAKLDIPEGLPTVWLEDLAGHVTTTERLAGLMLAMFAPVRVVQWAVDATPVTGVDDDSTVIFSSGSTGEPKGVPLSHFNVLSNVEAAREALGFGATDRLVHVLPFFHSFGNFMLWAGIRSRAGLILIPDPLDAAAVGRMVERYGGTLACATPTFLEIYRRRIRPEQFASLRIVVAGGEKLPRRTAEAFEAHFGKGVVEGYGCTECSPVVAVNRPVAGGQKPGSVGRALPGVDVRVADPDTFEPVAEDEAGMLLVRGPNVMRGYLGADHADRPLRDGWYVTGDIACVDRDGFITITDRLARFAKIGGEMVSHGRVEDLLHEAADREAPVFVVTSIPDEKKGENLVVVHVYDDERVPELCAGMRERGVSNLFIPKPANFLRVETLPLMGTGKIDLRAVKRLAVERLGGNDPSR